MFKSRVIIVLFTVLFSSGLLFGQSFTASGPSSATVGFGNSAVNVTYYFSYSNTGGLTVPKLSIWVDGSLVAGYLCQGADPYLPSSYTFSLGVGSHSLTFKLVSLGNGPDCASSALLWHTSTASVNCNFQISVENIFGGGSINANGTTTSPAHKTVSSGSNVSIGAIEQDYGGYHWIWNTNGTNNSEWDYQPNQSGSSLLSYSQSTSYSVQNNDANTRVVAALRKICNATFQSPGQITINGSNYNQSGTVNVVEGNTASASVSNLITSLDWIYYSFVNWTGTDGFSNSNSSITPTVNSTATYTANYTGTTANPSPMNIHFTSTDGQYISLAWTDHPSQNVTQYQVWRMIKGGTTSAIATLSHGTTSFTDYAYIQNNAGGTTNLFYTVKAYYAPSGLWNDPGYYSVSGDGTPRPSIVNNDNNQLNELGKETPAEYSIGNYPNPFNPTTTIDYQLPENGFVTIKVYDILGKEVATLVNENKSAGYYQINFDASRLTSGVYIYTINVNGFAQSKKMLLMK